MSFRDRQPVSLAGDEMIAALRQYVRNRAPGPESVDAAGVERSLLHLQRLATLGRLLTDAASDFGNLMTVILGYSELMTAAVAAGDMPSPEHLMELRRAAGRASDLIFLLLELSRQSSDDMFPLDLSHLVDGFSIMLGRLLGPGFDAIVCTDPTAGAILADARQVEQLIVNLVLNARDALDAGGRVEVAVESSIQTTPLIHALGTAPPGEYVCLRVTDDGRGMNRQTVDKLFRPFFPTKNRGAGLGLTIVARIAGKCNAAVIVESAPAAGTTVKVLFPKLADADTAIRRG